MCSVPRKTVRSNRREFLKSAGTAAVASLAACARAKDSARSSAGARPNIVLIISDDHGWPDYGFMGHPQVRTPNLDRLASQSVVFTHGYVPTPLCCPSLASIITGRYPHQHKMAFNDPPMPPKSAPKTETDAAFRAGRDRMNSYMDALPTLPRVLASAELGAGGRAGYLSLQTGKWWQGHFSHGGFTHGMTHGDPAKGGRHGDAGLDIGRKTMQPIFDFIATAKEQNRPFFVWYAPMMPHTPHTAPERLLAKYRDKNPSKYVTGYWAMVEWFDETCGQLLDYLDKQGLADNTIVSYVADNGWIQNPDGPLSIRSKLTPYDAGLRTPIMLRWLGRVEPRKSDVPVSSIDLMPTLLRMAEIEAPTGLPGVNLLDDRAVARRDAVLGTVFEHSGVDIADPAAGLQYRWCVSGGWKLIDPNPARLPNARPELYHVAEDPHEKNDLAERESTRVGQLRKRLDAWWSPTKLPASRRRSER
ncbi:sulfatase-like hydrolase/transferase [Candidatus Sumerlaeota bacterium]|nr:sulfatase-like hydrolase/transferase [Candidatus Sumerlaeota bacterium]